MARSNLEILMTAKDQASKVIGSVGSSLKSIGGAEVKAAGAVLAGVAAGLTAVAVGATKLAIDAAPLQTVSAAFDGLAESAGKGSDEMLKALQDASSGMITNRDLMMSFNRASQLVSKDFAVQLPDAMSLLAKAAGATGQDMNYMLDSLVTGVGRLSPMILDNLGIQVSLTDAYDEYAATLGKSTDELTKSEQQTALMNTVLEKLKTNTESMPDVAGTASQQFAAFGTTLKNLKDDVGLALLPVFQRLMEWIGPLLQGAIEKVMPYIEKFAGFLEQLAGSIIEFGINSEQTRDVFASMFGEETANTIMNIVDWMTQLKDTIYTFMTETLIPFVYEHWETLKAVLIAVGAILAGAAIVAGIMSIVGAITALMNPIGLIIGIVALLAVAWTQNWGGIQEKTQAALEFIRGIINSVVAWIQNFWAAHGEQIKATAQAMWDGVVAIFNWFKEYFTKIFDAFKLLFQGDFEGFGKKLREVWDMVWKAISEAASKAWEWLKENFTKLVENIIKFITETDWLQLGKDIIQGIANGITAATKWVIDAIVAVAKAIWGALVGFFSSDSPSKLTMGLGKDLMAGWAIGIQDTAHLPSYAMAQASQQVMNTTTNSMTVLGGITVAGTPSKDDFLDQLADFML